MLPRTPGVPAARTGPGPGIAADLTRPGPGIAADLTRPGPGDRAADARLEQLVAATSRYCARSYLPGATPSPGAGLPVEDLARPLSAAALSLAVALRCGALQVPADEARARAVQAVRACVRGHVSSGGPWGRSWQSPLVAAHLGLAGWLLGDALPDRPSLERLLAEEATLLCGPPVRYLRDVAGTVLTPGDTGAEEESWRARGVSAALAMLPGDPRAARWQRWLVLRQVVAFAAPSDVRSTAPLHGSPLCGWLAGSNAEDTGELQNHGVLPQPNYMRSVHNLVAVVQQRLAGQRVSPSALHGVERMHAALVRLSTPDGKVRYPQGTDVAARVSIFYANDALHRALGLGGVDAARWETLRGGVVERQVQPDGSVVEPGNDFSYSPAQPDVAGKLAEALLAARLGPLRPGELDGTRPLTPPAQDRVPGCLPGRRFPDTEGATAVAAAYVDARGLLPGRPDGRFTPSEPVDRGTAVLGLHRAAGSPPATAGPGRFTDAPADGLLATALAWAQAAGVAQGTSAGRFSPDAVATRGQALLLLWRAQGRPPGGPSPFADAADGELGRAAGWAVSAGVVRGREAGGRRALGPGEPLTRGQWALLLHRLAAG